MFQANMLFYQRLLVQKLVTGWTHMKRFPVEYSIMDRIQQQHNTLIICLKLNAKAENTEKLIEQPNSCEISVNAKGQYSGKIKVYAATIDDAMVLAKAKAEDLEKLIKAKNGG